MLLLPWWPFWLEGAALYAGTLLAWALALYVATRGGLRPVPVLASLATFMLVAYLLGQTVGTLTLEENLHTGVIWFRRTWWGAALAPALWLLLTLALAADEGPEALLPRLRQAFWGAAVVLLGLGLAFTLAGLAGEAVLRWSAAFIADRPFHIGADTTRWHVPPGPWFGAYVT